MVPSTRQEMSASDWGMRVRELGDSGKSCETLSDTVRHCDWHL